MGIIENQKYLVWTCTLFGIQAHSAVVSAAESDSKVPIDFLSEVASKEALLRVRSALESSGDLYPGHSTYDITAVEAQTHDGEFVKVGLGRSALHLDLPLAVATLASRGLQIPKDFAFAGELSLGGDARHFRGAAPMARALKLSGTKLFVVPADTVAEVEATGLAAFGVRNLTDVYNLLLDPPKRISSPAPLTSLPNFRFDFKDVRVAPDSQWPLAVEVALAGNHSLLFEGNPGCGSTMIAQRLTTCLQMDEETQKEATDISSVTGLLTEAQRSTPAFRAPHHTISEGGITGANAGGTRPGEASLAHGGVLYLDEAPEFRKHILERIHTVYLTGKSNLWQGSSTRGISGLPVSYPADFLLVASMNSCPCGAITSRSFRRGCICTEDLRHSYHARLETLNLDIRVQVQAAGKDDPHCESSEVIRTRVMKARALQFERQGCLNGDKPPHPRVTPAVAKLTAIAQTLADLDQPDGPADAVGKMTMEHIQIAMGFVNE
jgi:magnesium chelatase family protein